jgi:hypothetical protein
MGHTEIVAMLLARGADINHRSSYAQETPLSAAVSYGQVETALMLLRSQADPTITNRWGQTPLQRVTHGLFADDIVVSAEVRQGLLEVLQANPRTAAVIW